MLDIEDFKRKRKRVFNDKDNVLNLAELKNYIQDLEIISDNEKSKEISNLIEELIPTVEEKIDETLLFKFYWLLFQQSYYFIQNLKRTEELLLKMRDIAERTKNIENIASVLGAESLYFQLKGNQKKAIEKITESMETIKDYKERYKKSYFSSLYAYTIFVLYEKQQYKEAIDNMRTCLEYYYTESSNVLGLIHTIHLLLRLYILLGKEKDVDELLDWVLKDVKIQEQSTDPQYILLFWYLGTISAIRYKIADSILYLNNAYIRIKKTKTENQKLYEYIEILKLLIRSYAYKGEFQKSYNNIVELLNYIETDFVKENYLQWRLKRVYFSVYYSLLFIFVQLDMQIDSLEDPDLKGVYKYIKTLIEDSKLPEDLLLDTSLSEEEMKQVLDKGESRPDEFNLTIYQQLVSLDVHKASEETIDKIQVLKKYAYSPLYADILLGKIHLSMGNFKEFKEISERIRKVKNKADTPITKYWIDLFGLLKTYLTNPDDRSIIDKFESLKAECKKNNFLKMSEEVNLYQKLISSTKAFEHFKDRFNQTAFIDIYNSQSRKLVLENLETKD